MKTNRFLKAFLVTGISAATGAIFYKINKAQRTFKKERWNSDIEKRYKMADSLLRDFNPVGKSRNEIISMLGLNGLRVNNSESMEYYLGAETQDPKLLILDFNEDDKVYKCTACL